MWDVGFRVLYLVWIVCYVLLVITSHYFASVALSVGVCMYLGLVGHAGLRDLSGHDWNRGVGHEGLHDLSGHDSGCVGFI